MAVPGGSPAAPPPEFKPPTPAAPPSLPQYGAGYTEQAGKLNFQVNNELAGDKLTFENAEHNYLYQNTLRENKEPQQYGALRRAGVLGGTIEAGFMGGERGRLATGFAAEKLRSEEGIKSALERANLAAGRSIENYTTGLTSLGNKEQQRYLQEQERLAPQTLPSPPTGAAAGYPGATAAVNAAFPGGINQQRAYIKAAANGEGPAFLQAMREGRPWVSGNYAQRARGGAVQAGKSYVVGERGPERFTPRQNGLISPLRARAGKKAARR